MENGLMEYGSFVKDIKELVKLKSATIGCRFGREFAKYKPATVGCRN